MTPETKAKIEAASSKFLKELDEKYCHIEQANMPNIICEEAFTSGATYGYNLAIEEMNHVNLTLHEQITTLEARVEETLELARDLDMHTVHTTGCNNARSSLDDCLCGLKEPRVKLKSYLQNKGG